MFGRQKIAALVAEFLGAGVLTLVVLTVQRSSIGLPFFVAATAGLSIVLMSFVLGTASKAHFNPAITLGWWTARKIETVTAILYIAFQFLGAYAASRLYVYFVHNDLQAVGGKFGWTIFTAEAVGAGIFALCFASAVYQGFSRAVSASFIGLGLMIGIISASSASLGLLNPAVALGVDAWVLGTYVAGPIVGAVIGINLYSMLFAGDIPKLSSKARVAVAPPTKTKKSTTAKKKKK
jgi:glycerol uptake facilitator-like aquaporin